MANPRKFRNTESALVLRNHKRFQEFENDLLLETVTSPQKPNDYENLSPNLKKSCDEISLEWFGVTYPDTQFRKDVRYEELDSNSDEDWELINEWNAHEETILCAGRSDDELIPFFRELGIDFADERGIPMRLTKCYCRQAEAALLGRFGAKLTCDHFDAVRLEEELKRDAEHYVRSHRSSTR